MTTLTIVRHHVQDYAKWRKTYDAFAPTQRAGGVIEESVYQDKDDPNELLVLHRFANREKADAFLASTELRDTMKSRSEEHTSELQSHSFISYAVFCLTK